MKSRFSPVQTNTALYCQLHEAGHSMENLLRTQKAYRICRSLINGRYRKTERAFLCHAIGAASSMAHFDPRIELTLAAMLHASYDSGLFPDGHFGPSDIHRRWLAGEIGVDVETLVFDCNRFSFGLGQPEAIVEQGIAESERLSLLIALAHEIDDIADGGLVFAPKYGSDVSSRLSACRVLADFLGYSQLAETFAAYEESLPDQQWAAGLAEAPDSTGCLIIPNWWSYLRLRRHARKGPQVRIF